MTNNIKEGSYVKHVNPQANINNGLRFEVDSINEEAQTANCYIDGKLHTFSLTDLLYVSEPEGGWIS